MSLIGSTVNFTFLNMEAVIGAILCLQMKACELSCQVIFEDILAAEYWTERLRDEAVTHGTAGGDGLQQVDAIAGHRDRLPQFQIQKHRNFQDSVDCELQVADQHVPSNGVDYRLTVLQNLKLSGFVSLQEFGGMNPQFE